jgi:hypothetical protein
VRFELIQIVTELIIKRKHPLVKEKRRMGSLQVGLQIKIIKLKHTQTYLNRIKVCYLYSWCNMTFHYDPYISALSIQASRTHGYLCFALLEASLHQSSNVLLIRARCQPQRVYNTLLIALGAVLAQFEFPFQAGNRNREADHSTCQTCSSSVSNMDASVAIWWNNSLSSILRATP